MAQSSGRIIVVSPFEHPDVALVVAAARAGALGVLDIGRDPQVAAQALATLARVTDGDVGVRVPQGIRIGAAALPRNIGTVIVDAGEALDAWRGRRVLVQVTTVAEARIAHAGGAAGLIAKGNESGGRVGAQTSFVLLQALVDAVPLPVWVQGGVGLHTAAACIAGGAAGVVLDAQVALARESTLPPGVKNAIAAMDGSETIMIDGHRVYTRPDLPVGELARMGAVHERLGGADLRRQLLPAGQEAAFAKPLAERYRTVGGIVRGIGSSIEHALVLARRQRALAENSPFAVTRGIRYPICQGPMTRVSDRASFAEAVANAGGLPFLALALMRGHELEALLAETSARLQGKPWGVGILGFVPEALRAEQLEVVCRFKPPVALIAGGRPAQAKPLEDLGTATFLHAPSPGLLDLFVKQGARRFVFEGSECGGHVGPRSSFALWEAQIERLLAHPAPQELEIVFAGGIHDARSAAMVAAMAAPLVERGAAIGVLMGTAYLFTQEAVSAGAILPDFQQVAIECTTTALLETAPGHSTRCAETEYVRRFRDERERLQREGLPAQEIWQKLEELNLGRLRVAAKGKLRDGDRIVDVDAATQRREGMVMLGQVAALHATTTTIARLHRDVGTGSATYLATLPDTRALHAGASTDIAIIGMSAIMPGAPDLEAFWTNIVHGVNSIREVSADRWRVEEFYDPQSITGEMTPSKWGGFLDPSPFDPLVYGIPPMSLSAIEPVQLLALEASRRALANAGYAERPFDRENTAVIFGAEAGTDLAGAYGFRALWRQYIGDLPKPLADVLPSMTEDSFPGILTNVIAGRIANRLDLGGTNYTVDAACASSLAAVDLACKELAAGTSNMVICGGADVHNSIVDFLAFASVHALSPTGQCRTFDAAADGIVLGEGVAAVVLKRRADAERDGDRIYAVIKGVGSASDGKSLGLTAPRAQGQARALARAYQRADVDPREVGLVEAHGTGTVVGDRTELETLNGFFGRAGAAAGGIALGSIKSQIGHTKCAAGLAGMVKSALALHRGILPPTLNISTPNPAWSPESPFTLSHVARPWATRGRKVGVSAFGFGGTNFHVVLAEHEAEPATSGLVQWPAELFLFRGRDRGEALQRVEQLAKLVERRDLPLRDLARATSEGKAKVWIAIVAKDVADLAAKLEKVRTGETKVPGVFTASDAPLAGQGTMAFLFPGQGSQRVGMLGDLFVAFPELGRYLELGTRWRGTLFPPSAWREGDAAAQQAALTDTRVAQPALGIVGLAMAALLGKVGVRPAMLAGHSYGELVALCVAGALPESALLPLSALRGERILEACADAPDSGTMAAVVGSADAVRTLAADLVDVVVANENSPEQSVISGPRVSVAAAMERLLAAGLAAKEIPVACAFHSPLVRAACTTFAADLADIDVAPPALPVYSNTTTGMYPDAPDAIRALLAEHVGMPVRFAAEIEAMYAAGARIFVEAGAGRVLTGLVSRILGKRPHVAVACDRPGEEGIAQFLAALARLAVEGVPVDVVPLFDGRSTTGFALDAPPAPVSSGNAWWVDGQRAWPMRGELPPHALRPITAPVPLPSLDVSAGRAGDAREEVVLEYLRGMRDMVETQRRVMMTYLGGATTEERSAIEVEVPRIAAPAASAQLAALEAMQPERLPEVAATVDVAVLLLEIVVQRTGYPIEMLDLDLDLEADLSIDSIKRVEILGAIAERLGARDSGRGELPENIVAIKTLRGIIVALQALVQSDSAAAASAEVPAATDPVGAYDVAAHVSRYVVELQPTQRANGAWGLVDRDVEIVGAPPSLETALLGSLAAAGSRGKAVNGEAGTVGAAALVDLTPLRSDWAARDVQALFGRMRTALMGGVSHVLVAGMALDDGDAETDGARPVPPSGGVSGLVKSLRKEWPDRHIRVANFGAQFDTATLAELILSELNCADAFTEVDYTNGSRRVPFVIPAERNGAAEAAGTIALDRDSVVLLTGGARGITARIALELGGRYRCKLELVGRTPLPEAPEDAELAGARDQRQMRTLLATRHPGMRPAEINALGARILAQRDVVDTLRALQAAGASTVYHSLDVRDASAMAALFADIYRRHGRLDGVIHGAGVVEDKLACDKTSESFARVFETKVNGGLAIAENVRDDVSFIVFFSSIVATFGNRGQSDYAAANDFLDRLAHRLRRKLRARVLSINWGPWNDAGMVSPELSREYARRGIALIEPEAGVASFLDELLHGSPEDAQVILMRGDPSALR
ncbi:MAG: SDR family NAD(P)-dependent oxidoreductase [Burkholderiales bacterium]|nr:SDR family NAD(P)-dependent oxidoreductase [Burkholderiales bacterium]